MKQGGFTIIEIAVSVGILSMALVLFASFIFQLNYLDQKSKADHELLKSGKRILDIIAYEVKGAESVYDSTSGKNQLSLETKRYLPNDETGTFIDFFKCGSAVCLKKESQNPVLLNSDSVLVTDVKFSPIVKDDTFAVTVSLTLAYKNPDGKASSRHKADFSSTISYRKY